MAVNSYDPTTGHPLFVDTDAPDIKVDPTKAAEYAGKVGTRLIGTTAERVAYAYARRGLGWYDTTADMDYVHTGSGWVPTIRPAAPFFRLTRDAAAFNFTNTWTGLQWDTTLLDGVLDGFSTSDRITYTCTVPGVYSFAAQVTAAGAAGQSLQIRLRKNSTTALFSLAASDSAAFVSVATNGPVTFAAGDTFSVQIFSSGTVAGVPGAATYCAVAHMHG